MILKLICIFGFEKVLTKTGIIRSKLLFILCPLALFILFTSYNDIYPEPVYYLFYVDENTTVYHSREIHYDLYGDVEESIIKAEKQYQGLSQKEIHYTASVNSYLDIKAKRKEKTTAIIRAVECKTLPDYIY